MKSKNIFVLMLLLSISCTKINEAGVQIDGNGKPKSLYQSEITPVSNSNPALQDSILGNYGIAIDPDGKN